MSSRRLPGTLFLLILMLMTSELRGQITWQRTPDLFGEPISDIVQYTDGTLLASSDQSGVFRSTNNATSWTQVNTGLTQNFVHDLLIDGVRIYAAANGGLFVTINKGTSWTRVTTDLAGDIRRIVKAKDGSLLAAASGVWRSTNNGVTWIRSTSVSTNSIMKDLTLGPDGIAYLVTLSEFFRSTNNGITWNSVKKSTTFGESFWSIAISPQNEIYLGTNRSLLRASDQGANWESLKTSPSALQHNAVIFNTNGDIIVGASAQGSSSGPGLFVSTDHGVNWTSDGTFADAGVTSMVFAADGHLLVGTGFDGIFRSTSAVKSGVAEPRGADGHPLKIDPDHRTIYHTLQEAAEDFAVSSFDSYQLYNSTGMLLSTGSHDVFDGISAQPGIYLLRLSRRDETQFTRIMITP